MVCADMGRKPNLGGVLELGGDVVERDDDLEGVHVLG